MIFLFLYKGTLTKNNFSLIFLLVLAELVWINYIFLLMGEFHLIAYIIYGGDIFTKC